MTFEGTAELAPIGHPLAAWVTTFDHLVKLAGDGGLDDLDGVALVGFMQEFERARNRLSLIDHACLVDLRVDQFVRRADSLCAARAPVLSDSTIQYGSSSVGLKSCLAKVKALVFFSTAFPVVSPWEVFQ